MIRLAFQQPDASMESPGEQPPDSVFIATVNSFVMQRQQSTKLANWVAYWQKVLSLFNMSWNKSKFILNLDMHTMIDMVSGDDANEWEPFNMLN